MTVTLWNLEYMIRVFDKEYPYTQEILQVGYAKFLIFYTTTTAALLASHLGNNPSTCNFFLIHIYTDETKKHNEKYISANHRTTYSN